MPTGTPRIIARQVAAKATPTEILRVVQHAAQQISSGFVGPQQELEPGLRKAAAGVHLGRIVGRNQRRRERRHNRHRRAEWRFGADG
jgi:hypothetical protein